MSLSKQTINETWQRESKTLPLLYYTSVWSIPCDGDILCIDRTQCQSPLCGHRYFQVLATAFLCVYPCVWVFSLVNIFAYYKDRVGLPPIQSLPRCHSMRLCQLSYPTSYQLLWIDVCDEAARYNVERDCPMRRANLRRSDSDFQRGACCATFPSRLGFPASTLGRPSSETGPSPRRLQCEIKRRTPSSAMAAPKWRTPGSSHLIRLIYCPSHSSAARRNSVSSSNYVPFSWLSTRWTTEVFNG